MESGDGAGSPSRPPQLDRPPSRHASGQRSAASAPVCLTAGSSWVLGRSVPPWRQSGVDGVLGAEAPAVTSRPSGPGGRTAQGGKMCGCRRARQRHHGALPSFCLQH